MSRSSVEFGFDNKMADYFAAPENNTSNCKDTIVTNPDDLQEKDEKMFGILSNYTATDKQDIQLNIQCEIMSSLETDFTGCSNPGNKKYDTLHGSEEKQLQYSPTNQENGTTSLNANESDGEDCLSQMTNSRLTFLENVYNRWKASHKVKFTRSVSTQTKIPNVRIPSNLCSDLDASSFKPDKYVLETLFGKNQCTEECNCFLRKETRNNDSLKEHFSPLSCEICQHSFVTKWGLRSHMANAHGMGIYTCDFCSKNYSYSYFAEDRDIDHPNVGLFECCVCSAWFDETGKLSEHKNSHHRVIKCLPSCEICAQNVIIEDIFYSPK